MFVHLWGMVVVFTQRDDARPAVVTFSDGEACRFLTILGEIWLVIRGQVFFSLNPVQCRAEGCSLFLLPSPAKASVKPCLILDITFWGDHRTATKCSQLSRAPRCACFGLALLLCFCALLSLSHLGWICPFLMGMAGMGDAHVPMGRQAVYLPWTPL